MNIYEQKKLARSVQEIRNKIIENRIKRKNLKKKIV